MMPRNGACFDEEEKLALLSISANHSVQGLCDIVATVKCRLEGM